MSPCATKAACTRRITLLDLFLPRPLVGQLGEVDLAEHVVEHQLDEHVLRVDVGVERGGADTEFVRDAAESDGLEALGVEHAHGSLDDGGAVEPALPGDAGAALWWRRGLGEMVVSHDWMIHRSDICSRTLFGTMTESRLPMNPHPRRWLILFVILAAEIMDLLDGTIVNVALPTIRHHLHVLRGLPAVDRRRLLARARDRSDRRRADGRPLRPSSSVRDRRRGFHGLLARVRALRLHARCSWRFASRRVPSGPC